MYTFQLIIVYFVLLQLKHVIDSDAAMSEDTIAYNIVPLDAPVTTNATTTFPEVGYFLFYIFVHGMWLVLLNYKKNVSRFKQQLQR